MGTKNQVDFGGKNYEIFYYNHVINDKQFWAFINDENGKTFDGTFKLQLTNMEEQNRSKECSWTFVLAPGERLVKSLNVIDPFEKVSVKYSSSYVVK